MTDDQQQPNEFPAPKPLPGSVYIRPGIDDRPDYDKVLSPEDKSAVARLAVHQPRRKVEASVTQAETQVAQMTSEGSPAAAAASVDTAVPDMGSAYVDMRDPVVSADGQRPNPGQVTRLSWGFAVGATMSIVPWAALNLLALPAVIAKVSWQRVSGAVASRAAFSGGGQKLSESLVSRIGAVGAGGVASAWAIDLAVVVVVGVVVSLIAEAVVSALSDRTRVAAGRRTPWIIAGGVVSAVMTLALGLCSNVVGIALLWGLVQGGYVMLTVPMAAAFNPLTDLTNMKARKQAEMDANTVAMTPAGETAATQAFNPVTGQFEAVPNPQNGVSTKTRAEQRAEAAKARKKKQIIIGSVVGGLVALLVILGVFFMLNKSDSTADMVEVPNFTATANISEARVEEQLAAKGLKLDAREDSDSSEPKGTITKQNPAGGKKVAKGSTVSVWFSTGPQSVAVPDVSNKSQDDAKCILEAAGFKVGNVRTVDNASIEKDKVVSTDPAAHSKQTKGTIITLYISSGMTKIPDNLIGQPKDTVIEQLKQAGLTQITIESEYSDSIASGAVTRVEPGVGSTVEAGTAVTIWVSTGKQQISVPSVVGMGYANAKSLLESYGFQVTVSGPEDGTVTDMSPTAGTQSDSGATITLTTKSSSTNNGGNNGNNGNNGGNGGNTDGGNNTPEGN